MEAGFDDNFYQFGRNMARFCDDLGMAGPEVVYNQAGALCRTLIEITPPLLMSQTAAKIDSSVDAKIASVAAPQRFDSVPDGGKNGRGDVRWYAWFPTGLFGVKRNSDMLDASEDQLLKALAGVGPKGRIDGGMRGKQHVWIYQKIVAQIATIKKAKARLKKRIGRLKAAWAVSWQDTGSPPGTLGPVPDWVMRHTAGSRQLKTGFSVSGLGVVGNPSFTIVNNAAGVSQIVKQDLLDRAFGIRAKAMAADFALYVRGVKKAKR